MADSTPQTQAEGLRNPAAAQPPSGEPRSSFYPSIPATGEPPMSSDQAAKGPSGEFYGKPYPPPQVYGQPAYGTPAPEPFQAPPGSGWGQSGAPVPPGEGTQPESLPMGFGRAYSNNMHIVQGYPVPAYTNVDYFRQNPRSLRWVAIAAWVGFALGFFFPIAWIVVGLLPCCVYTSGVRYASIASTVMFTIYVICLIVLLPWGAGRRAHYGRMHM